MAEETELLFPNYISSSNDVYVGFYAFVLGYTALCFLLISPLVARGKNSEIEMQEEADVSTSKEVEKAVETVPEPAPSMKEASTSQKLRHQPKESAKVGTKRASNSSLASGSHIAPASAFSRISGRSNRSGRILMNFLDRVAGSEYLDDDPDFRSRMSGQHSRSDTAQSSSSGTPSAATTSRLVEPKKLSTLVLDVGTRRWKSRRPIGRMDVIHCAISSGSDISALSSTVSRKVPTLKVNSKGVSNMANAILEESKDVKPADTPRPSMLMAYKNRSRFLRRSSRTGSYSATSEKSYRSAMSSIVDDISPNDAADANDPGRGNVFTQPQQEIETLKLGCVSNVVETLLTLALPEVEMRRVIKTTIPLSLGAISEAIVRLATAGFISSFLGSEAMVAFLLVSLFVRLTSEELSGAIIDAAASYVQTALFSQQSSEVAYLLAGQYVQHAIMLQLVLGAPLLAVWAFFMGDVVQWLVQSDDIAVLARDYTQIVIFHYLVQSLTRTLTVALQICGHEHFESIIDFGTLALQLIVISSVLSQIENVSIVSVAYIQLLIGVAGAFTKLTYSIMRGWMKPFRKGIFGQLAMWHNFEGLGHLLRTVAPMLLGTILEYGEWEALTLLLRSIGPAEVASWAILGAIWDIMESFTEGLGEAGASQVAFLLAAFQAERARRLANTVMYLAVVQSLIVTSILFMSGKYLAIAVTSDRVLQNLINDSFGFLGIANVTMTFSQVAWSLIGTQGRFRLATSIVFCARWLVTVPTAAMIIFLWQLDLHALGGALTVGYATSSCALAYVLLRSDWNRLTRIMQYMKTVDIPSDENNNGPVEDEDSDEHGDPFDDSDSSSSEGFGFGCSGDSDQEHESDADSVTTGFQSKTNSPSRSKKRRTTTTKEQSSHKR